VELKYGEISMDVEEWHQEHREASALVRTIGTILNVLISGMVALKVFNII